MICKSALSAPVSLIASRNANDDAILTKTADVTEVEPGDYFIYTITIENTSKNNPFQIGVITDSLPSDVTYVGPVTSNFGNVSSSINGNNLTIQATGAIAPGDVRQFFIPVRVNPDTTNTQINNNSADVRFNDGSGSNATMDGNLIQIIQAPRIVVLKNASIDQVTHGQTFYYTVTITNTGNRPTSNPINITDTLPNGVSLNGNIISSLGNVTTTQNQNQLNLSVATTLNPGQTMTLTIPVILN